MAHAEHPLVALNQAHTASHLIGQRLKPEPLIRRREGAGQTVARPPGLLHREEMIDRLLEPAVQQQLDAWKRNQSVAGSCGLCQLPRQVKPVDGVEEEQCADALVQVVALPAKRIQRGALGQQGFGGSRTASRVERLIAGYRIRRRDDVRQETGHGGAGGRGRRVQWRLAASSSTRPFSTSSRSVPSRARPSWVVSNPYFAPMS